MRRKACLFVSGVRRRPDPALCDTPSGGGSLGVDCLTQNRKLLFRSIAPGAAVCAIGFAILGYYDYRVTDDPLEPPYLEGRASYGTPQSFWWQPAVTVSHFDNPQLRDNYLNQLAFWKRRTSVAALWDSTWRRGRDFWRFFFIGPIFHCAAVVSRLPVAGPEDAAMAGSLRRCSWLIMRRITRGIRSNRRRRPC